MRPPRSSPAKPTCKAGCWCAFVLLPLLLLALAVLQCKSRHDRTWFACWRLLPPLLSPMFVVHFELQTAPLAACGPLLSPLSPLARHGLRPLAGMGRPPRSPSRWAASWAHGAPWRQLTPSSSTSRTRPPLLELGLGRDAARFMPWTRGVGHCVWDGGWACVLGRG